MKRQFLPWHSYSATAAWGWIVWLLLLALQPPPDLYSDEWARRLLLLAALCWVPLGLGLLPQRTPLLQVLILPAAIGLLVSMQFPVGWPVLWALPWLGVTAVIFICGAEAFFQHRREAGQRAMAAGQVFLLVGGLAAAADRLGLHPFGFDAAIILLTAVHFHYAGFIFPLLVGRAALHWPSAFFRWAALLVVVSVPATAVGITVAQLTGSWIGIFFSGQARKPIHEIQMLNLENLIRFCKITDRLL